MNADPWVHPNSVYAAEIQTSLKARNKWDHTYGNALNYSMRAPPKGRRCGYMSWMSDLPDEFLLSMHEYNIETAKHDLGRSKKKPPLPHQIRTQVKQPAQSETSYENKLRQSRAALVAQLDAINAAPEEELLSTANRPQSATWASETARSERRRQTQGKKKRPSSVASSRTPWATMLDPSNQQSTGPKGNVDERFRTAMQPAKDLFARRTRKMNIQKKAPRKIAPKDVPITLGKWDRESRRYSSEPLFESRVGTIDVVRGKVPDCPNPIFG